MSKTFGDSIKEKRQSMNISLREMAGKLAISPAYLSDIEKSNRLPLSGDKLLKLIEALKLSQRQQEELYDLAGQERNEVPLDLYDYLMHSEIGPHIRKALRAVKGRATKEDWERFAQKVKENN